MESEGDKVRVTLRIEPDVYAMLMSVINQTGRSLNSEINARIRDSLCTDSPVVLTTTEKVFQRIMREELSKQSKKI
ncbi:Arc family DNA-binding protein [Thiothrix lacustris]|uniref:Arc family DNA-binding protein n=1 Tax=Thiothrix lacustris TaxID=525917 RepID=A0ABY9MNK2_9GAMM|nr:Arc family DNA-binding protein [Thiothrix lacustris]WML90132.1 Arc family DNA-binding protein [Thiothrix lacustris]